MHSLSGSLPINIVASEDFRSDKRINFRYGLPEAQNFAIADCFRTTASGFRVLTGNTTDSYLEIMSE